MRLVLAIVAVVVIMLTGLGVFSIAPDPAEIALIVFATFVGIFIQEA